MSDVFAGKAASEVASAASQAAKSGADGTAQMRARAGRSSYVSEAATHGVADPGACGAAAWLAAAAHSLADEGVSTRV